MSVPSITTPPTAVPQRSEPSSFSTRRDAWTTWEDTMWDEMATVIAWINSAVAGSVGAETAAVEADDMDDLATLGFFTNFGNSGASNLPTVNSNYAFIQAGSGTSLLRAQIAMRCATGVDDYYIRSRGTSGWDPYVKLWHDGNLTVTEGTWTPALNFGGATTGITYSTQVGSYERIGRLVIARARLVLSSNGSATGNATIEGLPLSIATNSQYQPGTMICISGFSGLGDPRCRCSTGTSIVLHDQGATSTSQLDDTNFGASSNFAIQVIYYTT